MKSTNYPFLSRSIALLGFLPMASYGASQIQVNFDSGTLAMSGLSSTLLSPGTAADGDGSILQLGYYDLATISNNFLGTWIPLTGVGSLNTGGDTGSGLAFNTTSIGDIGGGAAPDGSGIFGFSLIFDDTVSGTFNSLPGTTTTPLAIRFYDGLSIGTSSYFNVVSNDAWLWKLPTTPTPLPPTISLSFNDAGLEWQSIAVAGQSASTAFHTSIPTVPEPGAALLVGCGLAVLGTRRRSRRG